MQLLQTPSEQSRLIHEVPEVVAEPEPASVDSPREYREEHKASLEPIDARSISKIRKCSSENNVIPCCRNDGMNAAEGRQQDLKKPIISGNQNSQQVSPSCPGTSVLHLSPQEESNQHKHGEMGEKLPQPVDIIEHSKQNMLVLHRAIKHYRIMIVLYGNTKGPYSMKVLKQWSESSSSCYELRLQFKVFKSGQRPEDALLLTDAIQQYFNC
ncbi:Zinc finger, PHD-type [Gossypium australe]|uniref:Zinc finger, PHD-type n=1 Tax=Gossypium australe TaxID=47621 RepID=A0A5B6V2W0_9ROSI|nr:Zinc finger, PHD-type [Gossypium australe]